MLLNGKPTLVFIETYRFRILWNFKIGPGARCIELTESEKVELQSDNNRFG